MKQPYLFLFDREGTEADSLPLTVAADDARVAVRLTGTEAAGLTAELPTPLLDRRAGAGALIAVRCCNGA